MKRRICQMLLCGFLSLLSVTAYAQHRVNGTVTGNDGESLPGVTILVKGTSIGVVTGADGLYTIDAPNVQSILVFSFVGMEQQEIPVAGQSVINVTMMPATIDLDEVVVTALGITRDQKSLGYSVSQVSGDDLQRVNQENILNSLSGRATGVTVASTGPAGSSVSMTIRGATSLTGDNQPLFVVDGIPMHNQLNNVQVIGNQNRVDFGSAISDINAEDIESISILKGPSAAALYGSRAGNGVVLITTKRGNKVDQLSVDVSSSTVFDIPYKYLPLHNRFAYGARPFDNTNYPTNEYGVPIVSVVASWRGPELDKGISAIHWPFTAEELASQVPVPRELKFYDNPPNFFQTGITSNNNIAITNKTDRMVYRVSYLNMANRGLIPNSDLGRHTLSTNASVNLTDNITISSAINFVKSKSDNRPGGDRGTNPMQALYENNPMINILDMKDYWEDGKEGFQQKNVYQWGYPNTRRFDNPWFLAYEVTNSFKRDRIYGNLGAEWQITPDISINAMYAHDEYAEQRETKLPLSNVVANEPRGGYGLVDFKRLERNSDVRLSYNKSFDAFSLLFSAGGNTMYQRGDNSYAHTRERGTGLITPGVYTLNNIAPNNLEFGSSWYQKAIYSVYGLASIGYNDIAYLDLTARNDWSSTLPAENRSYFYPSASLSLLVNNMFELPASISLIKLRGGYAQVGNDTDPYRLYPVLSSLPAWGGATQMGVQGNLLTPDLKPERQTSYEIGADLSFFQNRLVMEATWYNSENENQILGVGLPLSTGYNQIQTNAGILESKGWEASIGGMPVSTSNLRWSINFNLSRNRVILKELAPGLDYLQFWSVAASGAASWIGDEVGQLVGQRLIRVDDPSSPYHGYPLLSNQGREQADTRWTDAEGNRNLEVMGNFNHKLLGGVQSTLNYKRFTLNISMDYRIGGQFVSQTNRFHNSDHHLQTWLDIMKNYSGIDDLPAYLKANADKYLLPGNKHPYTIVGGASADLGGFPVTQGGITLNDGAFIAGVIPNYDSEGNITGYRENLGGPGTMYYPSHLYGWSFMQYATFDSDFIKLREVSLSFQIPPRLFSSIGIGGASISVFSRNIILWTKAKIGIDPELAFQPGTGGPHGFLQGTERFNVSPWTIPVGVRLNVNF